jgi:hypothetical protein
MGSTAFPPYGLTTSEAIRAYREGRPDQLPPSNRWKHFVEDHSAGQHDGRGDAFQRVCPICRMQSRTTAV